MNGIIMRIRMRICLRALEDIWYGNNDTVAGEAALGFSDTKAKLKVLKSLEAAGCVVLSCHDNSNRPYAIRPGGKSSLYALERSELWLNRIISFIAGILTTVAADYIIRLLQYMPSK